MDTKEKFLEYDQLPFGFHDRNEDWLLKESKIIELFYRRARQIGCEWVQPAPLGFSSTFERGIESIQDKVFAFEDKKGRKLMLTPDSIPAIFRWYLTKNRTNEPERIFFRSPIFRYRRQKNRFFNQIGYSIINEGMPQVTRSIDYGTLQLTQTVCKIFKDDMGLQFSLSVGDFGILYQCLSNMGISYASSVNILHVLRPLDEESRRSWVLHNLPSGEHRDLFIMLINFHCHIDNFTLNDLLIDNSFRNRFELLEEFCNLLKRSDVNVYISFNDLHSSEIQDGLNVKFYTTNGKIFCDGGCYTTYANRFDKRIASFKSIGTGIEGLIRYQNQPLLKLYNNRACILVMNDATSYFVNEISNLFIELDYSVVIKKSQRHLSKQINKLAASFDLLVVIGRQEELTGTLSIKTLSINKPQKDLVKIHVSHLHEWAMAQKSVELLLER